MRITIFTSGSQGDIQPGVVLGLGLQRAGYDVLLAAPENFAAWIQGQGLHLYPIRGDVQQVMASETGRKFMESGGANPLRSILAMRKMLAPYAQQMVADALEACRDADALISLGVFAPLGKTLAEMQGIPLILIEPTPLLPTGACPAPGWLIQRDLGAAINRLSGHAMLRVIWLWYRPFINAFRKRFGMAPLQGGSFHRILASTPLLGAYSPAVIPKPHDWPATVTLTGYWFQKVPPDWRPPIALERFLEQGEPPVYAGFGSMGGSRPEVYARMVIDALAKAERRGVLLTGWGGMRVEDVPENVFVIGSAPHGWLFPRMAAVIHHGGAGTTAEGLRAGLPSIIVPFIVDQQFWGKRVAALGAGPRPIPAKKMDVDRLAHAIHLATTDANMQQRAQALGAAIRSEDGLGNAVRLIQQTLGG